MSTLKFSLTGNVAIRLKEILNNDKLGYYITVPIKKKVPSIEK